MSAPADLEEPRPQPSGRSSRTTRARWLLPLLLVIGALTYYGSYLRCWFNPHDEGGTAVLLANRLLQGERPLLDVELGYNVGWFYPLVALFKLTGPHYLFTRAWFFLLSTIAALTGFRLVRLVTGSALLAFAAGCLLVVFPGSQFKNYIPLLAIANTCALIQTMIRQERSVPAFAGDMVWAGIILGATFLIRIDLGWLFTLLWLGALAWLWLDRRLSFGGKALRTLLAPIIIAVAVLLLHLPVFFDAHARGFADPFLAQYGRWAGRLATDARTVSGLPAPKIAPEKKVTRVKAPPVPRTTLPRTPLSTIWTEKDWQRKALAFLTYAPLVSYFGFLVWIATAFVGALRTRTFATAHPAYLGLLALGGALAVFPQFFFFRPDRPHLSEFMPLYMVAAIVCLWAMWQNRAKGVALFARLGLAIFVAAQIAIFGWFALQHPSAGTIAARTKRKIPFDGANGVDVLVQKKEFEFLENVRKTVAAHSKPGDYLICYPYQPGFNVMTDRPTYLQNVYVDNANQPVGWARATITELSRRRPAVIIIDDRAINRVEVSRFSRWAAPVYDHIRNNYQLRGSFSGVEVFSAPSGAL